MVAWVLSKKNFVAIFTSMDKNHLRENMDALKLKLDETDIKLLDEELLMKRFKQYRVSLTFYPSISGGTMMLENENLKEK